MLTLQTVLSRSIKNLTGTDPLVYGMAKAMVILCYGAGVPMMITQGLRTIAYQDSLYAQGRTKPGPIITDAPGGSSFHNYGLAVDTALLTPDGNQISYDLYRDYDKDGVRDWEEMAQIGVKLGFFNGVRLRNGVLDRPHFQLTYGLSTKQLRNGTKIPQFTAETANRFIVSQLQPAYKAAKTDEERKEIGALADELRVLSGQKEQNK